MSEKGVTMAWKKRAAAFLSALLIVSGFLLIPGVVDDASAEQGRYGINLGAAALRSSSGAWSTSGGMTVYYGTYGGSPVRYRVLPESPGTQTADEASLLLDADSILAPLSFNSDINTGGPASGNPNEWSGSELQAWLEGQYEAGLSGADGAMFSRTEAGAIADTALESASCDVDEVLYAACVDYASSAHLFALSAKEARTLYSDNADRGKAGLNHMWWVRSANTMDPIYAGYVMPNGRISIACANAEGAGVSPALNVRLSAVLFSSAADKTAAPEEGAVGTSGSSEWKLTLRDPGKSVRIPDGETVLLEEDGTVQVPYAYADDSSQNPVNQLSVMITDREYTAEGARILYYGALQDVRNEKGKGAPVQKAHSGSGTFVLPEGLPGGYRVYLLAECVSGGWYTDYAGEPLEIFPEPAEEEAETESESETGALTAAETETEEVTGAPGELQTEALTEDQTGETAEETTEGQTEEASEEMTEGQSGEASEKVTEGQSGEASEEVTEGQTGEASEKMTEDQSGEASEEMTEGQSGEASEEMTEGQSGETSEEMAEGQSGETPEEMTESQTGEAKSGTDEAEETREGQTEETAVRTAAETQAGKSQSKAGSGTEKLSAAFRLQDGI